jgi:dolichol-phosphate mannosyltransferase
MARRAPALPAGVETQSAVYVVMPACDEPEVMERAIRGIQPVVRNISPSGRLLVVDRRPFGESGALARRLAQRLPGVAVLRGPLRMGVGRAYRAGFERALAEGADLVVQIDADLSHDPADIARVVEAAAAADVVVGSRYVDGAAPRDRSAFARWVRRRGAGHLRAQLGLAVQDVTSGLACYRRDALAALLQADTPRSGYRMRLELLAEAHRARRSMAEIPVSTRPRQAGGSERTIGHAALAAWQTRAARSHASATTRRPAASRRTGRFARPSPVSSPAAASDAASPPAS